MATTKLSATRIFTENVTAQMDRHRLTITEAAADLGMSRPGLSRILHGHEDVTLGRAERIAEYFGLTLSALLREKKSRKRG